MRGRRRVLDVGACALGGDGVDATSVRGWRSKKAIADEDLRVLRSSRADAPRREQRHEVVGLAPGVGRVGHDIDHLVAGARRAVDDGGERGAALLDADTGAGHLPGLKGGGGGGQNGDSSAARASVAS